MRLVITKVFWCIVIVSTALRAEDKVTEPDLPAYSNSAAFRYFLRIHNNSAFRGNKVILAMSTFPDGEKLALECMVDRDGSVSSWRNVYNTAIQNSHTVKLLQRDLLTLGIAINDLPSKSASPPLERLVVVSVYQNARWVTRAYDIGALPKPMQQIYDIVGKGSR